MLRALLSNTYGFAGAAMIIISYTVLILLMLPAHELAHGWAANRLGDPTAKWAGRLTLNPFAHLDLVGTIMLLTVGIGYAKPVPVDPRNFRSPKRDMALTALAGPVSNLLMAVVSVGLFALCALLFPNLLQVSNGTVYYSSPVILYLYIFLIEVCASVNLSLAVFNLIPVPPLDGSRIFSAVLPDRFFWRIQQYERIIGIIFMVIVFSGVMDTPLYWLHHGLGGVICRMFGLPNLF